MPQALRSLAGCDSKQETAAVVAEWETMAIEQPADVTEWGTMQSASATEWEMMETGPEEFQLKPSF